MLSKTCSWAGLLVLGICAPILANPSLEAPIQPGAGLEANDSGVTSRSFIAPRRAVNEALAKVPLVTTRLIFGRVVAASAPEVTMVDIEMLPPIEN